MTTIPTAEAASEFQRLVRESTLQRLRVEQITPWNRREPFPLPDCADRKAGAVRGAIIYPAAK